MQIVLERVLGCLLHSLRPLVEHVPGTQVLSMKPILMNTFFTLQFSYCLLVWMCHIRANNNKINRLYERCL